MHTVWAVGLAAAISVAPSPAFAQERAGDVKPKVRAAVQAEVYAQDLSAATPEQLAPQWQPGDPVRVVEDLKSTDDADMTSRADEPVVRQPTHPDAASGDLRELPKADPYSEDDPVRVVDDLKQDVEDVEDGEEEEEEEDQDDPDPNAG